MNNERVASELVKLAKELVAGKKDDWMKQYNRMVKIFDKMTKAMDKVKNTREDDDYSSSSVMNFTRMNNDLEKLFEDDLD